MAQDKIKNSGHYQKIHQILLSDWDPMGIKGKASVSDEYDAFVQPILDLLKTQADEDQIFEELKIIALEDLGVEESPQLNNLSRVTAQKLRAVKLG